MKGVTDEQVWKMLDAWYQLIGRRAAPSQAERERDFVAMKRHIDAFEVDTHGPGDAA
jgi:hypothetical protein